jgi:hypothetical protein
MLLPKNQFFESRRIDDIDAMSTVVADGLTGEYVQLEAKPFTGQWTVVRTAGVVVQIGCEDIAVVRRLCVPANRWAVIVPIVVPPAARWNASDVRSDDVLICGPGAECFAFDPGGTRFAILSVHTGSAAARRLPALARDCAPSGVATLRPDEAYALSAELINVTAAFRPRGNDLGRLVQSCLAHAVPRTRSIESFVGRSQIVRRVEEFFRHTWASRCRLHNCHRWRGSASAAFATPFMTCTPPVPSGI